jgi:hypothetical protein
LGFFLFSSRVGAGGFRGLLAPAGAVGPVAAPRPHGVEATEPPADPLQTEDRLGVLGCCCLGHCVASR